MQLLYNRINVFHTRNEKYADFFGFYGFISSAATIFPIYIQYIIAIVCAVGRHEIWGRFWLKVFCPDDFLAQARCASPSMCHLLTWPTGTLYLWGNDVNINTVSTQLHSNLPLSFGPLVFTYNCTQSSVMTVSCLSMRNPSCLIGSPNNSTAPVDTIFFLI